MGKKPNLDQFLASEAKRQDSGDGFVTTKKVLETWLWAVQHPKLGPPLVAYLQNRFKASIQ